MVTTTHDRERENALLTRYHLDGDPDAREELVVRFLPFARDLALRYRYTEEPVDDLLQIASLGLLKAIDRYEPDRGSKFTSYAAPTILGELKRHFRDRGWALRVPRELQERVLAVSRARESLSKRLGRTPTVLEVAHELGCTSEQVLEAAEAARSYQTTSLDVPASRDEPDSAPLVDTIATDDTGLEMVESRDALASEWSALPEIEQEVVRLRFVEDLTQREIGERVGYSQMHVSRILRRALKRLEASAVAA
ncbi:MAG TPA: SigB/SigF/SigG family RNA polymerase sigma factor [Thermoleophilaceae bacterium]|nr:SigB/SigF/SigG family RNA polymerase sigma factor [Thermoleophilaceae bacterium]